MTSTAPVTAEHLLELADDGHRRELVRGEVRDMGPAGWQHGVDGGRLYARLASHVLEHGAGELLLAETGFLIARNPDTVRAPDIAFLRRERFSGSRPTEAFWPGAPDLAVEVVSPSDTVQEMEAKVRMWLEAGSEAVWVVNPAGKTVTVYHAPTDVTILTAADELTGDPVLPGFRCQVSEIFDPGS